MRSNGKIYTNKTGSVLHDVHCLVGNMYKHIDNPNLMDESGDSNGSPKEGALNWLFQRKTLPDICRITIELVAVGTWKMMVQKAGLYYWDTH